MTTAVVCMVSAGCGGSADVDLSKLEVGAYSTAVRSLPAQPSRANGLVLEAIRMSNAVADPSQFGSQLDYLWQAGPVSDDAGLVAVAGDSARKVLGRQRWIAGYHATYADTPQPAAGGPRPTGVALSILLLRLPDDAAARTAAQLLDMTDWPDYADTLAAPLPRHPQIAARYTPGAGTLRLDTPIGPFVLRLRIDGPPDGIEKHIGELDAVLDEQLSLLRSFTPTPELDIPSLPIDPDGLLARMVTTDPSRPPRPSPTFAVYGPTGALRDQLPSMRRDRLFQAWGVDRDAVSGDQHLYRLRDNQAANDMAAQVIAESSGNEQEIEGAPHVPDGRCFHLGAPTADRPGFVCRLTVADYYTEIAGATAADARAKVAAQYALLATR